MLFGGAAYLTVKVAWRLAVIRSWNLRARARARAQRRAARLEQTAQRDEHKGEKEEETEGPRQS